MSENFTEVGWNSCLRSRDWAEINESQDINEMVQLFTEGITESLDEIAPFKTVTIWSNYNFGLSDLTKETLQGIRSNKHQTVKKCFA